MAPICSALSWPSIISRERAQGQAAEQPRSPWPLVPRKRAARTELGRRSWRESRGRGARGLGARGLGGGGRGPGTERPRVPPPTASVPRSDRAQQGTDDDRLSRFEGAPGLLRDIVHAATSMHREPLRKPPFTFLQRTYSRPRPPVGPHPASVARQSPRVTMWQESPFELSAIAFPEKGLCLCALPMQEVGDGRRPRQRVDSDEASLASLMGNALSTFSRSATASHRAHLQGLGGRSERGVVTSSAPWLAPGGPESDRLVAGRGPLVGRRYHLVRSKGDE
jgi:hypothetical protein